MSSAAPPERAPPALSDLLKRWTLLPPAWRAGLVRLGGAWAVLILLFGRDWLRMVDQWWNASTYNHVLLIPPIIGWLVAQRWPQLRQLSPAPWAYGLIPAAAATLVWVLGAFAGFDLLRQAGAVGLLIAAVPLLLGPRVGMGLAFPLGYMAFLVPFGDELVPALQMITAHLTIALTHLSGIPAVVEGVFIDTPAGLFEVAEACSGVKFLIAMIALGTLVANVAFRSWRRRAAFMALAVVAPIIANGIRAWGTIYVAQFKGAAYAGGIDHIIYGWIFFALVIAAVLGLSWRFFDRPTDDPLIDAAALLASPLLSRIERPLAPRRALAALALIVAAGMGWSAAAGSLSAPMPRQIDLPSVTGWQRADYRPAVWWEPRAAGAEHRLLGRYVDARGRTIDVFYALYAAQDEGREAGGYGEGALPPDGDWSWVAAGPAVAGGKSERLLAGTASGRLAVSWYRSGDLLTGSNGRLKLANITNRLLLRSPPTMLLIISAEGQPADAPEAAVTDFLVATGPLDQWMDRIGQVR